jgi:signal peptidase I
MLRGLRLVIAGMAIAVWAIALRPQWLGGPAAYILVRGDSMAPTYESGELLLVEAQPAYAIGEVVAYRVPDGEVGGGLLVAHRIVRIVGPDGYLMQGDNNPAPDPWTLSRADIAGRVVLGIPAIGRLLALVFDPTVAGGLAAASVVMAMVARGNGRGTATAPGSVMPGPAGRPRRRQLSARSARRLARRELNRLRSVLR